MKPAGAKGKRDTRGRKSLEDIKEEGEDQPGLENQDTNMRTTWGGSATKANTKSKLPKSMKTGYRVNPQRELLTQEQRAEKYYELLEENTKLKTHQTELDDDIKKMAARLNRIKSLISKERKLAGGVLGNEFERELDSIIDENTELKDENK